MDYVFAGLLQDVISDPKISDYGSKACDDINHGAQFSLIQQTIVLQFKVYNIPVYTFHCV